MAKELQMKNSGAVYGGSVSSKTQLAEKSKRRRKMKIDYTGLIGAAIGSAILLAAHFTICLKLDIPLW